MYAKVKRKWVKALRSGDYDQGHHKLRSKNDNFCCLGVLCNLHAMEHPDYAARQRDARLYGNKDSFLPEAVEDWAGLNFPIVRELATMNDNGYTFKQLADYIDKNL
jgi:hypothetical protein